MEGTSFSLPLLYARLYQVHYLHSLSLTALLPTTQNSIYLTDEEEGSGRLDSVPKVTQLVRKGVTLRIIPKVVPKPL